MVLVHLCRPRTTLERRAAGVWGCAKRVAPFGGTRNVDLRGANANAFTCNQIPKKAGDKVWAATA